ncbi:MAG: hypothetical protein ACR2FS_17925 [Phormidesmis sp.]
MAKSTQANQQDQLMGKLRSKLAEPNLSDAERRRLEAIASDAIKTISTTAIALCLIVLPLIGSVSAAEIAIAPAEIATLSDGIPGCLNQPDKNGHLPGCGR